MARVDKLLWAVVLAAMPGIALALGLGDITLNSGLNQRLDAEIEIVGAQAGDMNDLEARLAPRETFVRYGIDYPRFLASIEFRAARNARGEDVLQVTSTQPIVEPFVTFLVEATWPRGRLLREYTVLLDPPVYLPGEEDTSAVQPARTASTPAEAGYGAVERPAPPTAAAGSGRRAPAPGTVRPARTGASSSRSGAAATVDGGDYGPVERGESLSRIAQRVRPSDATLNQTMIAIYDENPEAFIGNINLLRQGAVLRIPSASRIRQVDRSSAGARIVAETERWRTGSSDAAVAGGGTAPARAGSGDSGAAAASTSPALQLVAPESTTGSGPLQAQLNDSKAENARLEAQVQRQQSELEQLRDRLSLRDQQLADLQRQLSEARERSAGALQAPASATSPSVPAAKSPGTDLAASLPLDESAAAATDVAGETGEAANDDVAAGAAMQVAAEGGEGDQPAGDATASAGDDAQAAATAAGTAAATRSSTASSARTPPPAAGSGPLDFLLSLLTNTILWVTVGLGAVAAATVIWLRNRSSESDTMLEEFAAEGTVGDEFADAAAKLDDETATSAADAVALDGDTAAAALVSGSSDDAVAAPPLEGLTDDDEDDLISGSFAQETTQSGTDVDLTMSEAFGSDDANDPISEADFHMAYGLYDQAAELITGALESEPERTDLQAKLLEIYFVWGNKDEFLQAATRLQPSLRALPGEWEKVVIMGRQICPDDAMFSGDASTGPSAVADADVDVGISTAAAYDIDLDDDADTQDEAVLDVGSSDMPAAEDSLNAMLSVGDDSLPDGDDLTERVDAIDMLLGNDPAAVAHGDQPEWSDSDDDLQQDAELTEIARKLEARMEGAGDQDLSLSLDLGQTIAPDANSAVDIEPVKLDDAEDDGFGDFAAFTGVVEEDDDGEHALGKEETGEEAVLTESNDLLPLTSTLELSVDDLAAGADGKPAAGAGDETVNNPAFASLAGDFDTEEQPSLAMPPDTTPGQAAEDETQEGAALTGPSPEDTSTLAPDIMSGNTPGAFEQTLEEHATTGEDDAASPTVQVPAADFGQSVSSTAETVTAQVLNLRPRQGDDGESDETVRAPAIDLGFAEANDESLDEISTKLDLARAYIDMGDAESARSILEEVVQEGSSDQRESASNLLSSLG
jgi:pilus assembly protein FimV